MLCILARDQTSKRYLTNKQNNIDMWLEPHLNSQAVGEKTNPQHYVNYTLKERIMTVA